MLSQCWWGCSNYSSWKFDLRGCSSWKFWLGILKLSWNALQCNTMPLSSFITCNFWMTRYRNKLTENRRYASNQTISTVSWNLMSTLNFTNLNNTNSRPCKCFFFFSVSMSTIYFAIKGALLWLLITFNFIGIRLQYGHIQERNMTNHYRAKNMATGDLLLQSQRQPLYFMTE